MASSAWIHEGDLSTGSYEHATPPAMQRLVGGLPLFAVEVGAGEAEADESQTDEDEGGENENCCLAHGQALLRLRR